jgi:4-hydroxy-tetrahydrodipicolinate synthase
MTKPRFSGVITALVTPFHEDGSLDLASYRALVRDQLAAGVDGLVPCGTTGESVTLSPDEVLQVVKACKDEARGMVPVIAGAGANDTRKAVHNQRALHELGVDATLHVTPYYNKPTQEGLYRHFRAVAAAAPTPVILYNVPGRTGVDLLPETVARLAADCPTIVGVKEATGSVARAQDVLNRIQALNGGQGRDDFAVLSGDDGLILGLLAVGGHGVISVISHLCCRELSQMIKASSDGKAAEAQALARRISPLAHILFFRTSPIPVKTALAWKGRMKKEFRLPLCPLDDGEEAQLKKMLIAEGWLP